MRRDSNPIPNIRWVSWASTRSCAKKVLLYDFTTGEPTGPKPTLAVETQTVETPWNKAAFKVNATYAVAMTAGVFPKGSIDEVLGRPGNENLTAGDVIYNNGTQLTEQEVAAAMSEEGLVIESGELLPNTEYEFGVYAANAEGVGVSEIVEFTTLLPPQQRGAACEAARQIHCDDQRQQR